MILILEVSGSDAGKPAVSRKVIPPSGGSIGRLPENSLVLEDPHVSSRHAVIHCVDGIYYLEDKSRNGISINTLENRLEKECRYALNSGDRIFIEPYEITVSLANTLGDSEPTDPFGLAVSAQSVRASESNVAPIGIDTGFESGAVPRARDLIEGLVGPSPRPAADARVARDLDRKSALDDHIRPPAPVRIDSPSPESGEAQIPAGWNDSSIISPPPKPSPSVTPSPRQDPNPPTPTPRPPSSAVESDLAAVLASVGLQGVRVTPELAENFGEILRVVVAGVMDILQARQQTKDEFGMPVTIFKRADNNPLKFSANVEDALHNLLVKRNPAYLGPVDA
ncbi:MAG TPA: type VI secretion system-associated FHA domain protein TagH, partial [Rhodothermia bacterium]|nr:type VI secretion system-associated FHA domain protein TagH [Rhodothermia bacterium]